MKYLAILALCVLSLSAVAVAQEEQSSVADLVVHEERDFALEDRDGESEDVRIFKCSRAKGTYVTLLEGVESVSLPARVVITYECNFLIAPAITHAAGYRRIASANSTNEDDDLSGRVFSTASSFDCKLYPDSTNFFSKNTYMCGIASRKSGTGAQYYGRNFGVSSPTGLLRSDAGSCTVHSDDKIKCFLYILGDTPYLYTTVMEKVSDDVDDDIKSDLNNPKWSFSDCQSFDGCH